MAASVEFDYNEFIEVYPQFKALSETKITCQRP